MDTGKPGVVQALFRSVRDDGTCWLFVSLSKDRWAITCDGKQVLEGTSNTASVRFGVEKYLALTAVGTRELRVA